MSDIKDPRAEKLEERVANMAREVMPGRNLWPGIASRLEPRDNMGSGARAAWQPRGWASVGVAVAAGYLLATWLPLASISAWTGQETQPAQLRAELLANIQPALDQLPAGTRAVVETDLAGFEHAWLWIEEASESDPDNPLLNELLMSAQDRAQSVRDQLDRLTGDSAEGVEI